MKDPKIAKKKVLKKILKKGMKDEKEPKNVKDSAAEDMMETSTSMPMMSKYKNLKK